jgi:hypothetical protein
VLPVGKLEGFDERVENPLRDQPGPVRSVEIVDQDRELVAAEAGGRVETAQECAKAFSDRDQELVASEMAETVVHVLEAVEIDNHHRDVPADACSSAQRVFEAVVEQRPVRQPRQGVMHCLVPNRVLSPGPHDRRQHNRRDRFDELLIHGRYRSVHDELDVRQRRLGITHRNSKARIRIGGCVSVVSRAVRST